MPTIDDIARERERLAEQLARIDADRAKVAEQLSELEAAERVLSRFGQASAGGRRGRRSRVAAKEVKAAARPARRGGHASVKSSAAAAVPRRARKRASAGKAATPALGDATLRAVEVRNDGISLEEIRNYLATEFGIRVRPNHLGMALQRHRRAGRLEQRDQRWYSQRQQEAEAPAD